MAKLTTLYFSAPLIVVFLSIVILKEKVTKIRWMAAIVGLIGVVIAANPAKLPELDPCLPISENSATWQYLHPATRNKLMLLLPRRS